jgi:hypothetical protein
MTAIHVRRAINGTARALYAVLYMFVAALFFTVLHHFLVSAQFLAVAAVCAPTLALLFGFAGVLYGRARALPKGPDQQRCLYAAERALQAALVFMTAVAVGALIASFLWVMGQQSPSLLQDRTRLLLWFSIPIFLALMAFGAFFFAFRAVGHQLLRWVHVRPLARRLRNGT